MMELLTRLMARMEAALARPRADGGRKLLVPYVTGGYPGWEDAVRAAAAAGADAIEIGIPFSDPVMDGPVIQQASQAALDAGANAAGDPRRGRRSRRRHPAGGDDATTTSSTTTATSASPAGSSRPASPRASCPTSRSRSPGRGARPPTTAGVETVMLAAPTAPDERLPRIVARARGFVYAVGLLGVTGERARSPPRPPRSPGGSRRSPTCRCSSASGCPTPSRPARRARSPTASSRARRSCAG